MTLRIVADENMPNVEAWFSHIAQSIVRKPGRSLTSADLLDADVLLVRSVTQVNQKLLDQTPVKFVGSATIGTDHIDQQYLQQVNIPFHYAPGCNAQSVTDWLLSVLSRLHVDHDLCWWQKTIGVVGFGNVGSRVVERLRAIGCRVLVCDPIKYDSGLLPDHIDLDELLRVCDIVCLHTPHTQVGKYPTDKMLGDAELNKMREGAWLISAGRGPVIDAQALERILVDGAIGAVLDVWPEEPVVSESLLEEVTLSSPHVAGYSLEGKYTGTQMLAQSLSDWHGITFSSEVALPVAFAIDALLYQRDDLDLWASQLVLAVYDPARDTTAMKLSVIDSKISSGMFDSLRKEYPTRRELASVTLKNVPNQLENKLIALGFSIG